LFAYLFFVPFWNGLVEYHSTRIVSCIHSWAGAGFSECVNGMAFGSTIQKATFRSKKDGCGVESMATVHSFILFLGEVLLWMEDEIPVGAKAGSTIEKSWR
jgi:hypothetical protein